MTSTSSDRLPPNAPESELAIIGCTLIDNALAAQLRPEWFYSAENQRFAEVVRTLSADGKSFDAVAVAALIIAATCGRDSNQVPLGPRVDRETEKLPARIERLARWADELSKNAANNQQRKDVCKS